MTILLRILLILSFSLSSLYSLSTLQVNFDYKTFLDPSEGTYLETHLNFIGGTIKLSKERAYQAVKEQVADPLGLSVEDAAFALAADQSGEVRECGLPRGGHRA